MSATTAQKIIAELRRLLSAYILAKQVVTDNSTQFVAEEFSKFLK